MKNLVLIIAIGIMAFTSGFAQDRQHSDQTMQRRNQRSHNSTSSNRDNANSSNRDNGNSSNRGRNGNRSTYRSYGSSQRSSHMTRRSHRRNSQYQNQ